MQLEAKIKFLKKVNNFSDIIKVNSKNFSNDIFFIHQFKRSIYLTHIDNRILINYLP